MLLGALDHRDDRRGERLDVAVGNEHYSAVRRVARDVRRGPGCRQRLSSGILLTLGGDVAPKDYPAAFLESWRTLTDAGGAASPLHVSGIAAATTLSIATGVVVAIGLLGALAFVRWCRGSCRAAEVAPTAPPGAGRGQARDR